jgi:hypothetical protein
VNDALLRRRAIEQRRLDLARARSPLLAAPHPAMRIAS